MALNRSLLTKLIPLILSRAAVNMLRRYAYPFVPAISRELAVSVTSVQGVIAAQAGLGVAAPLFGPLSDRYGRKRVMLMTLLVLVGVGVLGGLFMSFPVFAATMLLFGLGKFIFDPATQAYIGDQVPYQQRGLAIGAVELSWSLALLLAAPIAGFMLGRAGLGAYYLLVSALLGLSVALMWRLLPGDDPADTPNRPPIAPWQIARLLRTNPSALGAVLAMFCISTANELFLINYGAWMEGAFDLVLAALGTVTVAIALGEVGGEFGVIFFADRFGKKRLTVLSLGGAALLYVALPWLDFSLPLALLGLLVLFFFVEMSIVAAFSLFTEITPTTRGVMMSGVAGFAAAGRFAGALLGGVLYAAVGDFRVMGLVAMLIGGLALVLLAWRVSE
ncbi:MAG: MFS transporter [Anaerolineae bacterium]|nr:MFS transporter [Anaerolineae bacterium]